MSRSGPSRRVVLVVSAFVVALAVGTIVTWNVLRPVPAADASGSSSTSAKVIGPGIRSTTQSTTTTSTPTSTMVSAKDALVACEQEVAAGEKVAGAARTSARHWSSHVDVQRKLDAGTLTAAQAEASWAKTQALGKDDVSRFESALATLKQVDGACGKVLDRTYATRFADTASFCSQRNDAIKRVVSTGRKVDDQWKHHLAEIGSGTHRVGSLGSTWWAEVSAAGSALSEFDSAMKALDTSPDCPT